MARFLTATLLCEGREDARFLERVLGRQLTLLAMDDPGFDVGEVITQRCRTVERAENVHTAIHTAAQDFDLILVHHDWNGRGKIDALRGRFGEDTPATTRLLGVVPVRETEAWVLSDPAAFPRGSAVASLPSRPRDVEPIQDPKARLEQALGRPYDGRIAEAIGERIDLRLLAQVPAYESFLQELMNALKELLL